MRTGAKVRLVSVVGDDLAGINVYEGMKLLKMVYTKYERGQLIFMHICRIQDIFRH